MVEQVPRRLRRFQRSGGLPPEDDFGGVQDVLIRTAPKKKEISKEIMTQLALDEVQQIGRASCRERV